MPSSTNALGFLLITGAIIILPSFNSSSTLGPNLLSSRSTLGMRIPFELPILIMDVFTVITLYILFSCVSMDQAVYRTLRNFSAVGSSAPAPFEIRSYASGKFLMRSISWITL